MQEPWERGDVAQQRMNQAHRQSSPGTGTGLHAAGGTGSGHTSQGAAEPMQLMRSHPSLPEEGQLEMGWAWAGGSVCSQIHGSVDSNVPWCGSAAQGLLGIGLGVGRCLARESSLCLLSTTARHLGGFLSSLARRRVPYLPRPGCL